MKILFLSWSNPIQDEILFLLHPHIPPIQRWDQSPHRQDSLTLCLIPHFPHSLPILIPHIHHSFPIHSFMTIHSGSRSDHWWWWWSDPQPSPPAAAFPGLKSRDQSSYYPNLHIIFIPIQSPPLKSSEIHFETFGNRYYLSISLPFFPHIHTVRIRIRDHTFVWPFLHFCIFAYAPCM